ncbi:MAG: VOC family protein [Ignavibacteriaceae bacterium]|jgi:catechol-2,3-dioxygenase
MNVEGFSEIVLIVKDIPKSKKFYEDVVDLTVESSDKDWVWFYVGDKNGNQRLAIHTGKLLFEEKSPLPEGKRWGQIHFAFEVTRDNLEQAIEKIKSTGIEVYGPVDFKWMKAKSYYFYDLDGNLIEYWSPDN